MPLLLAYSIYLTRAALFRIQQNIIALSQACRHTSRGWIDGLMSVGGWPGAGGVGGASWLA